MTKRLNVFLILGAVLVSSLVTFFITKHLTHHNMASMMKMDSGMKSGKPGDAKKSGKKVLYWKAPMDPTYIRKEPGKSPMGMDLVPVYEEEGERMAPGTVKIDPVTVQNIGVRLAKVQRRTMEKSIRTIGRVDYNEKKRYDVHSKVNGWVEKLFVDFTGEEVKKGDMLMGYYSPELVATQQEYLLAKKFVKQFPRKKRDEGADSILELSRRRLELWDVPEHQIRELDKSGVITKTLHIHSPARGVVIKKNVQEGMYIRPGMTLYSIADISDVWVYADIYEFELPWIKIGQEAEMTLNSYPGRVFKGTVSFIYPFVEAKTRTVKVRIVFDNPGWLLKPNMYANINLKSYIKKDAITVPKEAVLLSGERSIIIKSMGGGKFFPVNAVLGVEAGGYYQVLEGLDEGDEVVTSAQFLIDSESRLKEAVSKMLAPEEEKKTEEKMEHSGMNHKMNHASKEESGKTDAAMDHEKMKHEGMDHKEMDHGAMDHKGMSHEGMNHNSKEDSGKTGAVMDHGKMKHEGMDHKGMNHKMNHDSREDSGKTAPTMDHGKMKHEGMGHGG